MGRVLSGSVLSDALATFLTSLEIDVDPGEVTYLAINRGHLFVGHRAGGSAADAMIVDMFELTAVDNLVDSP